jgi:hypothetical protein
MLYTVLDNFYLSDEQLERSPSRVDGIEPEVETTLRIYGCQIIQEACILLDLPQVAAATGQVLLQRFFCKKSMREFDVQVSSRWSKAPPQRLASLTRHVAENGDRLHLGGLKAGGVPGDAAGAAWRFQPHHREE